VDRTPDQQREWLKFLHAMNEKHIDQNPLDTELSSRVHSYELAFRMQSHAPDAIDISKETDATKKALRRSGRSRRITSAGSS
jgi:hypothetical protein